MECRNPMWTFSNKMIPECSNCKWLVYWDREINQLIPNNLRYVTK